MTARVAVTGMGLLTSLASGPAANWRKLVDGRSGVRGITRFPINQLRTTFAATVEFMDEAETCSCAHRTRLMLNQVVAEAIDQAGTKAKGDDAVREVQVFIAVPGGETQWMDRLRLRFPKSNDGAPDRALLVKQLYRDGETEQVHVDIDRLYGFRRRPTIVSTACASGATAIQLAVEAIRCGAATTALAAAADSTVSPEGLIRFSLLSALSRRNDAPAEASRPFDRDRDGFVLGEGAAALMLEDEAQARKRGATILGFIRGCGDATDNYHRTRSDPSGELIRECITRALVDGNVAPEEIGAVNAHGTSTPENDKMEALGLRLALGEVARDIPVTSNKSMIGHTLSAAGLVEAAISLLSLHEQVLTPNINLQQLDDSLDLRVPVEAQAINAKFMLSNSFGFGGQNVSLILERA